MRSGLGILIIAVILLGVSVYALLQRRRRPPNGHGK
jgi:hypothetical protein